ncbi:MAG: triose-phosphate isomerase [Methanimicrococcus sp.]|nr:triose-phosphate isomerase [Methanimicrococcus sp.]
MSVFILLNLKTYDEGTGINAVKLAEACRDVSKDSGAKIAIAPQTADLYRVSSKVDLPVYAQHIDSVGSGSYTGHAYIKSVKEAGACGSLVNHSEKRLTLAEIEKIVTMLKENKMASVVCTNNAATTAAAASLAPDYVAIEPPELIGSGIPVSKADPDVIVKSVNDVFKINPNVKVLCGAGISKGEDLKAAVDLGAKGVLLASGIVKAKDPKAALYDLISLI